MGKGGPTQGGLAQNSNRRSNIENNIIRFSGAPWTGPRKFEAPATCAPEEQTSIRHSSTTVNLSASVHSLLSFWHPAVSTITSLTKSAVVCFGILCPPNILCRLSSATSTQRRVLSSVSKLPVSSSLAGESYDYACSAFSYVSCLTKRRILH